MNQPMSDGYYDRWQVLPKEDGTAVVSNSNGDVLAVLYPPIENVQYFIAMMNACTGYQTVELDVLARVRIARDLRIAGV